VRDYGVAVALLWQHLTMPASHQSFFYGPNALPDAKPTVSEH